MIEIVNEVSPARLIVCPVRAGLRAGVDNAVDVLLLLCAAETTPEATGEQVFPDWDESRESFETFEQHLERIATLAYRDVQLRVRAGTGVTIEPLCEIDEVDGNWRLPDLPWGMTVACAFRLLVPASLLPGVGENLRIAGTKVRVTEVRGSSMTMFGASITLPVLTAEEYDDLADDEDVREFIMSPGST